MGLGVGLWVVAGAVVWWAQGLSSQEWGVFASTGAIAIVLAGGILAIQGIAEEKPETLPIVKYSGIAIALTGFVSVLLWFIFAHVCAS
jgi:hypothetical protein